MARVHLNEAELTIRRAVAERLNQTIEAAAIQARAIRSKKLPFESPQIIAARKAGVVAALRIATNRIHQLRQTRDAELLKTGRMKGGVARCDHAHSRFYTVISMV